MVFDSVIRSRITSTPRGGDDRSRQSHATFGFSTARGHGTLHREYRANSIAALGEIERSQAASGVI